MKVYFRKQHYRYQDLNYIQKKRFVDYRRTVVQFRAVVKNVSHLQKVQIVAMAQPATCLVDTRAPFSGSKGGRSMRLG